MGCHLDVQQTIIVELFDLFCADYNDLILKINMVRKLTRYNTKLLFGGLNCGRVCTCATTLTKISETFFIFTCPRFSFTVHFDDLKYICQGNATKSNIRREIQVFFIDMSSLFPRKHAWIWGAGDEGHWLLVFNYEC